MQPARVRTRERKMNAEAGLMPFNLQPNAVLDAHQPDQGLAALVQRRRVLEDRVLAPTLRQEAVERVRLADVDDLEIGVLTMLLEPLIERSHLGTEGGSCVRAEYENRRTFTKVRGQLKLLVGFEHVKLEGWRLVTHFERESAPPILFDFCC